MELKVVEELFVRFGPVLELRLGGRVIETTGEHPFFRDGAWVAANELRVGDRLLCADGTTMTVEGVRDTGEWVRVYNLRIADWHTYFVGCDEWRWALWAHNRYSDDRAKNTRIRKEVEAELRSLGIPNATKLAQNGAGKGDGRALLAALQNLNIGLTKHYSGPDAARARVLEVLGGKETKTLGQWLKDKPDLMTEARDTFKKSPEWQGIDPDSTPVFYRPKAEVDAIRAKPGEGGGHHPHGLALGGPEGQTLTITGDTKYKVNPEHSASTGLQKRMVNVIKVQLE